VLDIVGPAWNYILLRGIYTSKKSGSLFFRLKPDAAALIILAICFLIETAQYFKLYEARFDPYDYLAYVSLLLPVYLIDKYIFAGNYRPERSPAITGQGDA
jgi:hypothetical protein